MPVVELHGQRIHYEDSGGDGIPVVFGHGFLMDGEMFLAQVRALAPRHRVVRWDARGHGRTEATTDPFTYWDLAQDLAALLDHLGIELAVVGGMSQGGFVALRFALEYPNRVRALVLIDTQSGLEDPEKSEQYDLMHEVWTGSGPSDQLLSMVAAIIIGNEAPESPAWIDKWRVREPRALTQIYRTLMDRDDITDGLGEIKAPALVIHGTDDVAIDMPLAERLCQNLRGCRGVVKIDGAGHASNLTHPEPVNRAIEEFLDSL